MATIHQIEANRLNAQKSTGPRSSHGKAASSMNALKSGIDAQSQIIRGEDPAALEALTAEYIERFRPSTPEQRHYVDTLIRGDWQLQRLAKADAQIWEYEMQSVWKVNESCPLGQAFCCGGGSNFLGIQRRIDSIERSYTRALHELERLQSAPPAPEPAPAQPFEIPPPLPETESAQDAASSPRSVVRGLETESAQDAASSPRSVVRGLEIESAQDAASSPRSVACDSRIGFVPPIRSDQPAGNPLVRTKLASFRQSQPLATRSGTETSLPQPPSRKLG